jgi:hypothetical protein
MSITTLSSREFNQKVGFAKKAAEEGPVFITDRGQQTHVLLNVEDYRKITGKGKTLYDALYYSGLKKVDPDVEFPKLDGQFQSAEYR